MSRRLLPHPPGRLRRLGAVVALFGLIFASTVASVSHSIAMPLMAGAVLEDRDRAQPVPHHGHGKADKQELVQTAHHADGAGHDCLSNASAEVPQQTPQGPCDEGCMLCKDCTMTPFMPIPPFGIDFAERYGTYAPASIQQLASINPPSPHEPPRV